MWKIIILLLSMFYINYVESVSEVKSISHRNIEESNQGDIVCTLGAVGPQPHPSDCTSFIECSNGNAYIKQCGPGTAFSIPLQVCDYIYKVDCNGRERGKKAPAATLAEDKISCPSNAAGFHPHPYNCHKFLHCANGQTYIQDCAPGTAFDSVRRICDFEHKVKCCATCTDAEQADLSTENISPVSSESSQQNSDTQHNMLLHTADLLCLEATTGFFPYPFDYKKFINCTNGVTLVQHCVPGTAFSISKGYCENLDQIYETDHVLYDLLDVDNLISCPPGTDGMHLYPFNAELYVYCSESQMKVLSCQNDQVFSVAKRGCLSSAQVSRNQRVRLLKELELMSNYRITTEHYYNKNSIVYCQNGVTGTYPYPFDSTKYLTCSGGRLNTKSCDSGKVFSLSLNVCVWKGTKSAYDYVPQARRIDGQEWTATGMEIKFGSNGGLTYLACPAGLDGYFLHPFDEIKYIECRQGSAVAHTCSNSNVFSTFYKECIPATNFNSYPDVKNIVATKNQFSSPALVQGPEDKISCPSNADRFHPHPYNCNKFLHCANGQTYIQDCAPGTAFDSVRRICDFEHKVKCCATCTDAEQADLSTENISPVSSESSQQNSDTQHNMLLHTADLLCLEATTGFFPYPFDYKKFINCTNGVTLVQHCVPGTAFSISKGYCENLDQIYETDHVLYDLLDVDNLITCPPGTDGMHLYPFNAELYVYCSESQMKVLSCQNDQVFSVAKRGCLPSAQVSRNQRVRLLKELELMSNYRITTEHYYNKNSIVYCQNGVTGTYPYPFDSTKYLTCSGGRLNTKSCDSGKVFSLSLNVCVWKDKTSAYDYVPQARRIDGQEWTATGMEIKFGSNGGLTYLACPAGLDGYFLHPFDKMKYIECRQGSAVAHTCSNSNIFSTFYKECIPATNFNSYPDVKNIVATKNQFSSPALVQGPSNSYCLYVFWITIPDYRYRYYSRRCHQNNRKQ